MYRELLEEAKTMEADLIAWRRKLHTMPELGLELPDTSTFVREKLEEMGIPYEIKVNGSCVVGILGKGTACLFRKNQGRNLRPETAGCMPADMIFTLPCCWELQGF